MHAPGHPCMLVDFSSTHSLLVVLSMVLIWALRLPTPVGSLVAAWGMCVCVCIEWGGEGDLQYLSLGIKAGSQLPQPQKGFPGSHKICPCHLVKPWCAGTWGRKWSQTERVGPELAMVFVPCLRVVKICRKWVTRSPVSLKDHSGGSRQDGLERKGGSGIWVPH